jgi:hypothetical protein
MTERTAFVAPHLQALKLAFSDSVGAFGKQEAAAAEVGRSQGRLCDYGRPNVDVFPPLDVIDALEARTEGTPGWPHVTRALCRRRGGAFVALPAARGRLGTRWSRFVADLGKEAGELISGICRDLDDDNDVSPAEARRRLKDAADLVRVAVELEAALKARAEEAE